MIRSGVSGVDLYSIITRVALSIFKARGKAEMLITSIINVALNTGGVLLWEFSLAYRIHARIDLQKNDLAERGTNM